jgi:hypothetical protein
MLVPRPVADVFKHFCKIERYRYHEALEEIMKRAGYYLTTLVGRLKSRERLMQG